MSTSVLRKDAFANQEMNIERLQLVMDVAVDGIWDWRIDKNEVYFDPRYYSMAGYAPNEFPAGFQEWEKRVHPEDLRGVKSLLKIYLEGGSKLYLVQFRYRAKNGDWIWVRSRGKIVAKDADGNPTRMIGTHTDITELKAAELVRQQSEEKYRLFIENAHDCIFITQDGVMKYANRSTELTLGYSRMELATIPFIEMIHPDDRQMVLARHKSRLAGKETPNYYSFRVRNKAGPQRRLELNAVRIDWEDKPAVLCFVRDITEIKKMEQQLLQSQKMQAIGALAGGIAHDFNNILSAMMGYTELCQMEVPVESKLAGRLERVLQAGHRARDLVNQILAFSRQEETDQKPVQVSLVVKEALKLLRASIPASIEFAETIDPDTGAVLADPTRIHQIVMNLCTNAAHAMQAKGGILEVRLLNCDVDNLVASPGRGFLEPGPHIELTVADNGTGMDAETVKRIFDPYFTTKKQGEGTGLGLSVAHGIVVSMGGAIKVYSEPGQGTTFRVYFPCMEADTDSGPRTEVALPTGSETILLVDDEEFVMEMTRELLEKLGYLVFGRNSSVEAYKAFQAMPERFDLLITDQTMPKLTGLELTAKVRALREKLPVILTTGFSAGIAAQQIECLGIEALLHKPVLKHDLAATVRTVLDRPHDLPALKI